MVSMKRLYEPPEIIRVAIVVEEALLAVCKDKDVEGCSPDNSQDPKSANPVETKCFDSSPS